MRKIKGSVLSVDSGKRVPTSPACESNGGGLVGPGEGASCRCTCHRKNKGREKHGRIGERTLVDTEVLAGDSTGSTGRLQRKEREEGREQLGGEVQGADRRREEGCKRKEKKESDVGRDGGMEEQKEEEDEEEKEDSSAAVGASGGRDDKEEKRKTLMDDESVTRSPEQEEERRGIEGEGRGARGRRREGGGDSEEERDEERRVGSREKKKIERDTREEVEEACAATMAAKAGEEVKAVGVPSEHLSRLCALARHGDHRTPSLPRKQEVPRCACHNEDPSKKTEVAKGGGEGGRESKREVGERRKEDHCEGEEVDAAGGCLRETGEELRSAGRRWGGTGDVDRGEERKRGKRFLTGSGEEATESQGREEGGCGEEENRKKKGVMRRRSEESGEAPSSSPHPPPPASLPPAASVCGGSTCGRRSRSVTSDTAGSSVTDPSEEDGEDDDRDSQSVSTSSHSRDEDEEEGEEEEEEETSPFCDALIEDEKLEDPLALGELEVASLLDLCQLLRQPNTPLTSNSGSSGRSSGSSALSLPHVAQPFFFPASSGGRGGGSGEGKASSLAQSMPGKRSVSSSVTVDGRERGGSFSMPRQDLAADKGGNAPLFPRESPADRSLVAVEEGDDEGEAWGGGEEGGSEEG